MWVATLAQLVEHPPCKRTVVGSSPTGGSIFLSGRPTPLFPVFSSFRNVFESHKFRLSKQQLLRWRGKFAIVDPDYAKARLVDRREMDGLISFGLGLLTFVAAFCLAGLARAMRNDKLPPNMWAGIRTKAASESESSWYQVQRAGSVPLICLAVAYADSGLLFILQGIYHEVISPLIPVVVFSAQSLVGIIWIYKASSNSDPSQNQSGTSEVSERIK